MDVWSSGCEGRTDGSLAAGGAVHCGYLEETIGIDLEGGDELGLSTGHRRDTVELELSEQTVVFALRPFAFVSKQTLLVWCSKPRNRISYTGKVTVVWLSSTVVNVRLFMHGMVVLRGTTIPKTSPCMATPRESGATSSRRTCVFSEV